ncbi:hypothetical protein BGX20_009207 [Mortierella sp. AD010]|nr:hypothetical protein BGX20_009207 [Mortierella sp. AD010]
MSSDVTMTNAAQPQLKVGQRIVSDHIKGTVRFIGEVPPTKGEWIGVEWDDKERGKHSGEHNGTKYFDCLFPGTGSFTRISKKIETGSTLLEVLTERYVDKEKKMEDLYLGQSGVKVDVFDFDRVKDRQKNLDSMEIVGLANTNVARAADFDETQKACPGPQDDNDFKTLTSLRLADNLIEGWLSIDQIGLYTTLRSLWIGNNPVLTKPPSGQQISVPSTHGFDPRTESIVRLPHIVQLNGSEISEKDRLNAELYYVTQVAHSTKGMDEAAILAIHPRFEELCKVHGRPDTSDEFRKATSDILKDRLIVSKSDIDGPVKASFKRKVLGTMTVKNLKNLAQKLLRIPSQRQQLVFLTNDPDYADVKVKVYLKDDMRQISFYDITDGEEIIVLGAPAGK